MPIRKTRWIKWIGLRQVADVRGVIQPFAEFQKILTSRAKRKSAFLWGYLIYCYAIGWNRSCFG